MKNDKISIIMPSFNAEKYLREAIKSIENQSYKNWELIVVDDGSTDSTVSIVNSFSKFDNRIKLIANFGKGAGAARNTGITKSQGEFLAFIDSDDIYDSNFLLEATKLINKGADCVVFDYFRFKGDKSNGNVRRVGTSPYNSFTACWNKVYNKKLWKSLRFDEENVIEDLQVVPIVVGRAEKICHADGNIYYYYRENSLSVTRTETMSEAKGIIKAVDLLVARMKENQMPFDNEAADFINQLIFPHLVRGVSSTKSRVQKRNFYLLITRYLKEINKNEFDLNSNFYCIGKWKMLRTQVVMFLMKIGLYNMGAGFMRFSWYIGGIRRRIS